MRALVAFLTLMLAASACSSSGDGGAVDDDVTEPVGVDATEATFGTWDAPLPAGTPLTLTAWEITPGAVTVLSEGPDSDDPTWGAPDKGHVHVVVEIEAVRIAGEPGSLASWDDGIRLGLSSGGTAVGDYVALPIEDEISSGDVGPGDVASGSMLAAANVPEDALAGIVLNVKDHGSGTTAYVELEL